MRGTIRSNGPILGGATGILMCQLAPYAAYLALTRATDPGAWGLLLVASAVTSMLAYVGAELSDAIRGTRP